MRTLTRIANSPILTLATCLTIISFTIGTTTWYANVIDAPDTYYYGFPIIFMADGWHTSMSLQIFILELLTDLLLYFLSWFLLIGCMYKFIIKVAIRRVFLIPLLLITLLFAFCATFRLTMPENLYYLKRNRETKITVIKAQYTFFWQSPPEPQ